ncbi:MAG TPA: hypothetical protein VNM72_01420 [Blastocatellia bacterium]|nr:hypothetical protein [Blastocatellia bacterium]
METVVGLIVPRPEEKVVYRLHHLSLDKGYDYEISPKASWSAILVLHLKQGHEDDLAIRTKKNKKHPASRRVVERTHARANQFRRVLVRWKRELAHYGAMIHLACVLISSRHHALMRGFRMGS